MPGTAMKDWVEVRRCQRRAEAEQYALVLAAVGIQSQIAPAESAVGVYVASFDARRARDQLAVYEQENAPGSPPLLLTREGWHGLEAAMAYGIVLLAFFVADRMSALSVDWSALGATQAGLIADGAWWRTLTSLTLHADLGHLIANLAFGIVAGVLLAQLVGSGVAWLLILLSGGLGNALNVVVQSPAHTAIGASTSVFGALGILSVYKQASGMGPGGGGIRRFAPVAAGIMLLAFLGFGGERTDVLAHVAGFGMGAAIGLALARVPREHLAGTRVQVVSGSLAVGLLALAWLSAFQG